MEVEGFLTTTSGSPQNDLTLQANALATALAIQYQDLIFCCDDGSVSGNRLVNAGSISGVKIVEGPSFPTSRGPEYATIRSFRFKAEAEYPYPGSQNLMLDFQETLTFWGGDPIYKHRLALNTIPQKQMVYAYSTYQATQQGRAVGYRGYPSPPAALWPYSLTEAPRVSNTSPKRRGRGYQGYTTTWEAHYEDAAPLIGVPTLWVS